MNARQGGACWIPKKGQASTRKNPSTTMYFEVKVQLLYNYKGVEITENTICQGEKPLRKGNLTASSLECL